MNSSYIYLYISIQMRHLVAGFTYEATASTMYSLYACLHADYSATYVLSVTPSTLAAKTVVEFLLALCVWLCEISLMSHSSWCPLHEHSVEQLQSLWPPVSGMTARLSSSHRGCVLLKGIVTGSGESVAKLEKINGSGLYGGVFVGCVGIVYFLTFDSGGWCGANDFER